MDKKTLLNVVSAVTSGLKTNEKDGRNLLFRDGYVYAWSPALSCKAKLPSDAQKLSGIVNGDDLLNFLSKLKKQEIEIDCSNEDWVVSSGSMKATLNQKEDDVLIEKIDKMAEDEREWVDLPENFYRALSICYIQNNGSSGTMGVAFKDSIAISTNNQLVNKVKLSSPMSSPIWLSQFACQELLRIGKSLKSYAVNKAHIVFASAADENGVVLEYACSRLDESAYNFDMFNGFVEKALAEKTSTGTLPKIADALSLASCFDCSVEDADDYVYTNIISLVFKQKELVVKSERQSSGSFSDSLPFEKELQLKEPVAVRVSIPFLVEVSRYSSNFFLCMVNGNNLIVFTGDDFVSLVGCLPASDKD